MRQTSCLEHAVKQSLVSQKELAGVDGLSALVDVRRLWSGGEEKRREQVKVEVEVEVKEEGE
jgi:hypothetical protein